MYKIAYSDEKEHLKNVEVIPSSQENIDMIPEKRQRIDLLFNPVQN